MTDAPRVLIVDLARSFGGASARALGLLSGVPDGRACVACLQGSPVHEQALARGLPFRTVGRGKIDPRIVPRLRRVIQEGGFRVLDTQNVQSKLWAAMAARRSGAAVVSTLNSWYEDEQRGTIRGRVYQALERWTASATDLFIVVSNEIRARLIAAGIPEDAIALIPNAVSLDPETVEADRNELLNGLGLAPGARLVCAVGRLVEAKGHASLVDAVALAGEAELCCVIVGEGRLRADLSSRIARLGQQPRVRLLGERPPSEVLKIVKASDVFVMPSTTEGTPIALLEAAALARPIVAARVGGIPDIVDHGVHALLVEPGDPTALAAAIRQALADPGAALTMGRRARERVVERFGLATQVQATLGAWQRAHDRAERRARGG